MMMMNTHYQSKQKFKANKTFQAGYGAVEFRDEGNKAAVQMIVHRRLISGQFAEFGCEAIPRAMVADLKKGMKPFTN